MFYWELIFFKDVAKDMAIALLPNARCTILCAELVSQSDIGDNLSFQHKAQTPTIHEEFHQKEMLGKYAPYLQTVKGLPSCIEL